MSDDRRHYKPLWTGFLTTPEGKQNDRPERVPCHWHEHGMPQAEVQARVAAAKARARAIHGVEE